MQEGIHDLAAVLRSKESVLRVRVGDPATVLFQISTLWKTNLVHAQRLYGWEEQVQERAVAAGMDLRPPSTNTLLLPEDLPFPVDQLPHVFTAFRTRVERAFRIGDLHAEPDRIPAPRYWGERVLEPEELPFIPCQEDARAALHVHGGRATGLERLDHYLWKSRALSTYKETRNGLLGADYSSKFSPWLASGALSAREVFHAVKRHEREHGANESTYWLIFELLWRDFFQFTAAKHGADLFKRSGIAHKPHRGDHDQRRFRAWCEGEDRSTLHRCQHARAGRHRLDEQSRAAERGQLTGERPAARSAHGGLLVRAPADRLRPM